MLSGFDHFSRRFLRPDHVFLRKKSFPESEEFWDTWRSLSEGSPELDPSAARSTAPAGRIRNRRKNIRGTPPCRETASPHRSRPFFSNALTAVRHQLPQRTQAVGEAGLMFGEVR